MLLLFCKNKKIWWKYLGGKNWKRAHDLTLIKTLRIKVELLEYRIRIEVLSKVAFLFSLRKAYINDQRRFKQDIYDKN